MTNVLFVCHGNICRSPMAEFVMKDLVARAGVADDFFIASAATSTEEIGNPVYPPARRELAQHGIDCAGKRAVQMRKSDYAKYDYLLGADSRNLTNMLRMVGRDPAHKICRLLDFTDHPRDIADPWYTGDFQRTWDDVVEGCTAFLAHLGYEIPR